MMIKGMLLLIWGIIGIAMGMMMFGDIGVACIVGAVTAIFCGIGFIVTNNKIKKICNGGL